MLSLTYADRELLLQTLDSLKADWRGSDSRLVVDASEWAKGLRPELGFEHALTRDIAVLSRYLTENRAKPDIAEIARGALLYVLRAAEHDLSRLGKLGLLDDAFITSYAVHEIRNRLGDPATYNPPRLRKKEQERAKRLFLEFVGSPVLEDEELVAAARNVVESLGGLAACGLFRRLGKNIDFLTAVLGDVNRDDEQQSYARAALSYLVCEQDAIDDRLGIVGYLDDNFIVQMAVDLIEPAREPWLDLLDATVAARPFLNWLLLDDGSGPRPVSEYMIINSALSCAELRGGDLGSTALVVPLTGPTPFLLGFVSALGLIQQSGQRELTEESFWVGQKVLVDYCAVAEFAGYDTLNGRRSFKLRQYYTDRGQRLETVQYWPISDLRRLVPADSSRVPRGQLTYDLHHSDIPLPALEYLFNAGKTADLAAVTSRTLVVMPVHFAREMANEFRLHGHRLKDVIPMGHLTGHEVKSWSSRFGKQEPVLVFASDLDIACEFAEERSKQTHLVIVDARDRNVAKAASLYRLQHFRIPTLLVAEERTADDLNLDEGQIDVWEWKDEDFKAILWPAKTTENGSGTLGAYERRLKLSSSSIVTVESISFDPADRAFEAVRSVRALARERGDEHLVELEQIVSLCFGLLSRLLRAATLLKPGTPSYEQIEADFRQLAEVRDNSHYLTEGERQAAAEAERHLRELFVSLQAENPKADVVDNVLAAKPGLSVICPDARLIPDLQIAYGGKDTNILSGLGRDVEMPNGAVIPGWFRRERMAALLTPPVTSPIYLVLYGIEQKWYSDFRRAKRKARTARSARRDRGRIFPNVSGWQKPEEEPPEPTQTDREPGLQELEAIQEYVRTSNRRRIYRSARSAGREVELPARLILFEGGTYAFLTECRKANVVTHLLATTIDETDTKADVKQKSVRELKPGDVLLFNRGSDRDVIRVAADKLLAPGVRETASLWRTALLGYMAQRGLTPQQVHERLRAAGCPLKYQTVKIWLDNDDIIAPQAYGRDVRVVATVTGDERLASRMDSVLAAIKEVRSAHLRASHLLAKEVIARAVDILKAQDETMPLVELEGNVVVLRVVEVDDETTMVRASMCNRLLEGDGWHE